MPNLENLKKQAKLVLRWHRDRYYPVAAQIRTVLPRFRHLSDPRNPRGELQAQRRTGAGRETGRVRKLAGAQVRDRYHARASRTDQSKPVISATAAELFVSDIKASCDFFTQKLGFSIVFVYGEPPFYAQVKRDRGLLNLKHMDAPRHRPRAQGPREPAVGRHGARYARGDQAAVPRVSGGGRARSSRRCRKEPWGAKTFIVKDPDGNLLLFAGPAE